MELLAKKFGVLVKSPNELLRFGGASVEQFFRMDMVRSLALAADLSMLEGAANGNRIKGLINYSGVNPVTAGTTATDGNTLEPEDLGKMMSEVEQADHDIWSQGWSWVMRPELHEQILNRRAHVYDGSNTEELGTFLFSVNRADLALGRPTLLRGYTPRRPLMPNFRSTLPNSFPIRSVRCAQRRGSTSPSSFTPVDSRTNGLPFRVRNSKSACSGSRGSGRVAR